MEVLKIILSTLGGVSVVLTGLFAYFWNLRLEKFKADLADTNTKLKAALESSVHVSKAQFDKEFAIYQQIWVLLVALRAKTLSLRQSWIMWTLKKLKRNACKEGLKPLVKLSLHSEMP
ncbi:MAG: hypothetical protein ACXWAT_06955 [Methylobacter sp.]